MQLVALVLLAVAPALGLSVYTGQQQRRVVQDEAHAHVLVLARVATQAIRAGVSADGSAATILQDIATQSELPEGSLLLLLNSNGGLLARAPNAPVTGTEQPLPEAPVVDAVRNHQETAVEAVGPDGRARLYGVVPVPAANDGAMAYLGLGLPTVSALAGVSQATEDNQAGLELLAVLALAAAWIGGDWLILRHVRVLVGATRRLGAGELDARSNLRQGPEELVQLAHAFDDMAARLQHDLAERARAEEALRASEQRTRLVIDTALDAVVGMDATGRITLWNAQAEGIFGWSRDEVIGRLLETTIIPPAFREAHAQGLTRFLATGEGPVLNKRIEITALRQDGQEFPVELAITPLRTGQDVSFNAFLRDITQRRQAERRLAVQYTAARILTEADGLATAAPEILETIGTGLEWDWAAMWRIDPQQDVLYCVNTWRNPSVEVATFDELSRHTVLPRGMGLPGRVWASGEPDWIPDVAADQNFPRIEAALAAGLRGGFGFPLRSGSEILGVIEFLSRHVREPDTELLEGLAAVGSQIGQVVERERAETALRAAKDQLEVRVFERTGELASANTRLQSELTERLRTEEELQRAKAAAEAANRAKSTFLANMSHELRTPLNAIIGYSEMLEEDARDTGNQPLVEDLAKIQGAGRHLLALINNVLDLSKVEAGKSELYVEAVALAPLLAEVIDTIHPLVVEHANVIDVSIASDLGVIHTDVTKIRQALFNLLSNACKFTEHGTIRLAANRQRGDAGDWITLAVSDTGLGMTPEQVSRLFQPFTQADPSTTRRFGGTGLGLALSKHFCEMLGGGIDVESEFGVGSTFRIRLPAVYPNGQTARPTHSSEGHVAATMAPEPLPNTVLVIDDDQAVRDTMRRFLEKEGFHVAIAEDGEEGLRLARALHPVAITLDIMMPRLDGWGVLAALKAEPELASIPVVVVSILDQQQMGRALGAAEYVIKPVDWERLAIALRRLSRSAVPPRLLVVEDDVSVREMTRRLLERQGWLVDAAENGRVALERLQEREPDLILLDLLMPELDGFEFVAAVRAHASWRTIPIVVNTGKSLTADERLRLEGQVQIVFEKGTTSRELLLAKVRDLVAVGMPRHEPTRAV